PAEDGIRDFHVTGVQTCALPIYNSFAFGYSPNLSLYANENCCQSHAMLTALFLIRQTAYCISLNKSYKFLSYAISYRIVFVIFIVIHNQLLHYSRPRMLLPLLRYK